MIINKKTDEHEKEQAMLVALTFIDQYVGTCGKLTISKDNSIIAQDLFNMNEDQVNKRKENLSEQLSFARFCVKIEIRENRAQRKLPKGRFCRQNQ